jgi:uncharacterized membrane protein
VRGREVSLFNMGVKMGYVDEVGYVSGLVSIFLFSKGLSGSVILSPSVGVIWGIWVLHLVLVFLFFPCVSFYTTRYHWKNRRTKGIPPTTFGKHGT